MSAPRTNASTLLRNSHQPIAVPASTFVRQATSSRTCNPENESGSKKFASANVTLSGSAFYRASGATAAHDDTDRIIYDTSSGNVYYDPDGTAAADAILFARLVGEPLVTAADFFIVS